MFVLYDECPAPGQATQVGARKSWEPHESLLPRNFRIIIYESSFKRLLRDLISWSSISKVSEFFSSSSYSVSMPSNDNIETTEVVIIGCGPTGALLSALLGKFGVKNIVLEKEPGITNDPRGITLDEDGIRFLQEVGLYDKIYTEIGSCMFSTKRLLKLMDSSCWYSLAIGILQFITSGNNLHQSPFLQFNMNTVRNLNAPFMYVYCLLTQNPYQDWRWNWACWCHVTSATDHGETSPTCRFPAPLLWIEILLYSHAYRRRWRVCLLRIWGFARESEEAPVEIPRRLWW